MDLDTLIAQWSGQLPPGFVPHAVATAGAATMRAAEMQKTSLAQGQRGVREVVRTVQDPKGQILQASPGRAGRRRRLPALRVPQASGRRFPMPAVPRGARHRARAEAPGRHRRRGHRRVRRPAGPSPQGFQSRPRNLALEREAETGTDCRLLVAAAGPGAEVDSGMEALHQRQRLARESPLIDPGIRGRGASAPVGASRPSRRSQRPPRARRGLSRADGYRRRSAPFTGRDTPPTLPIADGDRVLPRLSVRFPDHARLPQLSPVATPAPRRAPCPSASADWIRPVCDFRNLPNVT